jgi:hypothetical protein
MQTCASETSVGFSTGLTALDPRSFTTLHNQAVRTSNSAGTRSVTVYHWVPGPSFRLRLTSLFLQKRTPAYTCMFPHSLSLSALIIIKQDTKDNYSKNMKGSVSGLSQLIWSLKCWSVLSQLSGENEIMNFFESPHIRTYFLTFIVKCLISERLSSTPSLNCS